jgi:hypothetical protein
VDHGCSYVEVPVVYSERAVGKSSALTVDNLEDVAAFLVGLAFRRMTKILRFGKLIAEKGELL